MTCTLNVYRKHPTKKLNKTQNKQKQLGVNSILFFKLILTSLTLFTFTNTLMSAWWVKNTTQEVRFYELLRCHYNFSILKESLLNALEHKQTVEQLGERGVRHKHKRRLCGLIRKRTEEERSGRKKAGERVEGCQTETVLSWGQFHSTRPQIFLNSRRPHSTGTRPGTSGNDAVCGLSGYVLSFSAGSWVSRNQFTIPTTSSIYFFSWRWKIMKETHMTGTPLQTVKEAHGDIQASFMQEQFLRKHILWIDFSDLTEGNSLMNYLTWLSSHRLMFIPVWNFL